VKRDPHLALDSINTDSAAMSRRPLAGRRHPRCLLVGGGDTAVAESMWRHGGGVAGHRLTPCRDAVRLGPSMYAESTCPLGAKHDEAVRCAAHDRWDVRRISR
jgi:hypothetical protein